MAETAEETGRADAAVVVARVSKDDFGIGPGGKQRNSAADSGEDVVVVAAAEVILLGRRGKDERIPIVTAAKKDLWRILRGLFSGEEVCV